MFAVFFLVACVVGGVLWAIATDDPAETARGSERFRQAREQIEKKSKHK